MSPLIGKAKTIRIRADDRADVLLEGNDGDRFTMSPQDVVEACQLMELGRQEKEHQWELVITRVREWVVANRDTVKEVFLAPRGQRNLILAVMKGQSHDSDLEDRLSELDLEIARDERVRVFEFDTMAVPDCGEESVTAFLPRIPE